MFRVACTCPKRKKEFFVSAVITTVAAAEEELTYWREFQAEGGFEYRLYRLN